MPRSKRTVKQQTADSDAFFAHQNLVGKPKKRAVTFTAELKRKWALILLAEIAELSQTQRSQVLDHAKKVNAV